MFHRQSCQPKLTAHSQTKVLPLQGARSAVIAVEGKADDVLRKLTRNSCERVGDLGGLTMLTRPVMTLLSGIVVIAVLRAVPAVGAVKLPAVIGDNMVLQQQQLVPIWGWDDPDMMVTVEMGEVKETAQADKDGKWMVMLPAMSAGGPHLVTIVGSNTISLKNVCVGEVWLCGGQSNMEWTVHDSKGANEEIAAAHHPRIRHIKIPHTTAEKPQSDVKSSGWQICTPESAGKFTAVGYYFARHLQRELKVPVGLIGSNWGGTPIEPWIPANGFTKVPALSEFADNIDKYPVRRGKAIYHKSPLALYNGMINPLTPYALKGVLWYQGESNLGDGMLYHEKMKALIIGWRTAWNRADMPFYFVQLAPYRYKGDPLALPGIWEAQTATLSMQHTGMAVTVDLSDIRPKNKQDVGKRLALWPLAKNYGRTDLVYSGPLYKSMQVENNKVRITFDHVGGGLISRDGKPLSYFAVAGKDQKFATASADIDDDTIVVGADSVSEPVAVRFAWDQEATPNLSNKAGLPASPFRTDEW